MKKFISVSSAISVGFRPHQGANVRLTARFLGQSQRHLESAQKNLHQLSEGWDHQMISENPFQWTRQLGLELKRLNSDLVSLEVSSGPDLKILIAL